MGDLDIGGFARHHQYGVPWASIRAASSVAARPAALSCRAASWAARRGGRAKPWGVCTARSRARGGVSVTRSSQTTFMVSVTARPGMTATAPAASASHIRWTRAALMKGRALSCTSTCVASLGRAASRGARSPAVPPRQPRPARGYRDPRRGPAGPGAVFLLPGNPGGRQKQGPPRPRNGPECGLNASKGEPLSRAGTVWSGRL